MFLTVCTGVMNAALSHFERLVYNVYLIIIREIISHVFVIQLESGELVLGSLPFGLLV